MTGLGLGIRASTRASARDKASTRDKGQGTGTRTRASARGKGQGLPGNSVVLSGLSSHKPVGNADSLGWTTSLFSAHQCTTCGESIMRFQLIPPFHIPRKA